jgi:hypothetical protein
VSRYRRQAGLADHRDERSLVPKGDCSSEFAHGHRLARSSTLETWPEPSARVATPALTRDCLSRALVRRGCPIAVCASAKESRLGLLVVRPKDAIVPQLTESVSELIS